MPQTFVLVHGAWHGGWCWERVGTLLERQGHRVYAPTLTGLAERAHLLRPDVGVAAHARDVAETVKREGLTELVLVGHSYGGFVVTAAAELIDVRSLVMLDAFLPEAGECLLDLAAARSRSSIEAAIAAGEPSVPPIPAAAFNVNEADRALVDAKCTPQPIRSFTEPVTDRAVAAREAVHRKAYIRAGDYPNAAFDAALAKAGSRQGWRTFMVPCGHDVMLDMPERLAEILLKVA